MNFVNFTPKGRKTCFKTLSSRELSTSVFCDTLKYQLNHISCTAGTWTTTLSILLLALPFCIKFYSQPSRLCNTSDIWNGCSLLLPSSLLKTTNISLCIFNLCTSLWPFLPLHMVPVPSFIPDTPWIIPSTDPQLCPTSDSGLLYTSNLVQSEVKCKFTEGTATLGSFCVQVFTCIGYPSLF